MIVFCGLDGLYVDYGCTKYHFPILYASDFDIPVREDSEIRSPILRNMLPSGNLGEQ